MSDPTGVIHDIGYRHYQGPRLGRSAISRALAVQSLRHAYGLGRSAKSKVMPLVLLAVMVVPAAISVGIMNALRLEDPPMDPKMYAFLLQPIVALYVASAAPQLFSRDLRYRSIVLYLARPPRRFDYALAKLVALVGALMFLIGLPLVVLYAGGLLAKQDFTDATKDFGIALAGAAILSILLAAIGGLIAAATPRRGFAVAAIIAVMLVTFTAMVTTVGILDAQGKGESAPARYAELASPFSLATGVQTFVTRETPPEGWMPTTQQGLVFIGVYLAVIALCVWGLNLRYAKVARG
jgi:ABC-2 type transport system permease protein